MPMKIWSDEVQAILDNIRSARSKRIRLGTRTVRIPSPFPSPADWRDHWIYFLLIDRFNNPNASPAHSPWDGEHGVFQGGTFEGIRQQLDYVKDLGVGAPWLSPILKNCQYSPFTYHGYGIQDFLQVEPRFASDPQAARSNPELAENELCQLIDEAHARGIYVIFDIVLNHAGDVFEYEGLGSEAPWSSLRRTVRWRDENGRGRADWTVAPTSPAADAAVWPDELRHNHCFRQQGVGSEAGGDFASLKELVTEVQEVRNTLIRAYQYAIAKFDVDGYRIDTLKYIEPEFARIFGNAMREFALSIGKKNFLTFGEVYDDEDKIAGFIGRPITEAGDLFGADAALDFPLFFRFPGVAKGLRAGTPPPTPADIVHLFEYRKQAQRRILSTHGDSGRFFVTFLDNHDQRNRFYFSQPDDPHRYDDQITLATACLFTFQGIPCLYYGTEQGLHGSGGSDTAVREALWGVTNAFDRTHPFFQAAKQLSTVRASQPALRYGRQYFRPISGDGIHFGVSRFPAGVLAFSRILNDQEIVIVANTNTDSAWQGEVLVDRALNPLGSLFGVLFSNKIDARDPEPVIDKVANDVEIHEVDGVVTREPARAARVDLKPMEVQILGKT